MSAPPSEPRAVELLDQPERFRLANAPARWEAPIVRPITLPLFARTEMPSSVTPERWARGIEVHERELPPQLYADLRELTPQALLRDLHRPVQEFFVELEEREGSAWKNQFHLELERTRAAHRRDPVPVVPPVLDDVIEAQHRRRRMLSERWQPAVPDDAPRASVKLWESEE
ncbi:MAG: hypothetical protein EXR72_08220 [Myxococcales bacterium]|nr:hypothetical protein [Myxococcales bacterium]